MGNSETLLYMRGTKRKLQRRYKTALKRVSKESLILDRARCRKQYWNRIAAEIEARLELIKDGQIEMPFN